MNESVKMALATMTRKELKEFVSEAEKLIAADTRTKLITHTIYLEGETVLITLYALGVIDWTIQPFGKVHTVQLPLTLVTEEGFGYKQLHESWYFTMAAELSAGYSWHITPEQVEKSIDLFELYLKGLLLAYSDSRLLLFESEFVHLYAKNKRLFVEDQRSETKLIIPASRFSRRRVDDFLWYCLDGQLRLNRYYIAEAAHELLHCNFI